MRRKITIFTLLLSALLLMNSCAKIVTPSGGPKDTDPPKVMKVEPENDMVNFDSKQIRIYFDEYVTLNNPSENVLISPPLSEKPEFSTKGKSVIVKFKEPLRPNTTYNMVFSSALKDFHEGNPLDLFHYSFSTGDSIDNNTLAGRITDSKTLAPMKDFFVMLYKEDIDSLPMTTVPSYVTKSVGDGSFSFKNIASGSYKIFALKDVNANFLYDLPNEEIAFLTEMVEAYPAQPDSLPDSLKVHHDMIQLNSFMATDTAQKLLRFENPAEGVYIFPYKLPVNNFSAKAVNHDQQYFEKKNPSGDTITWYMKKTVTDSLMYILTADSQCDTVYLAPHKAKVQSGRGRGKVSNNLSVNVIDKGEVNKPLSLVFPYPIRPTDSFNVYVMTKEKKSNDTVVMRFSVPDTFLMQLPLPMKYAEKKSYSVMIPDSVFYGYNNLTNDTIRFEFVAKSIKDYGTLIMNYRIPDNGKKYVATLSKGEKELQSDVLSEPATITYEYLEPTSYNVTVFCDENGNGIWDPGDYSAKRQAEKMKRFPATITIRAYWDSEETFEIDE